MFYYYYSDCSYCPCNYCASFKLSLSAGLIRFSNRAESCSIWDSFSSKYSLVVLLSFTAATCLLSIPLVLWSSNVSKFGYYWSTMTSFDLIVLSTDSNRLRWSALISEKRMASRWAKSYACSKSIARWLSDMSILLPRSMMNWCSALICSFKAG